MNRRERRAAMAKGRNQSVDRAVAVHEAGHVVARILLAQSLGWAADEVVSHIDINPTPIAIGTSSDGTHDLQSQATSYGQMFSRPMDDFLRTRMPDAFANEREVSYTELMRIVAEMRAAGVEVDGWYRAKSIENIFGPMAEARLLGKPFDEVWNAYSSEGDMKEVIKYGLMCGMTDTEVAASIDGTVAVAQRYMDRPEVWSAILALADNLKPGRTKGRVAALIVTRALSQSG